MRNLWGRSALGFQLPKSIRKRFCARLHLEQLETRTLLSVYPLSPVQTRHAYGFDQLTANGAGQTIAIVDAYDAPNIFNDLNTFDRTYSWGAGGPSLYSQFGASSSVLTKATPQGRPGGNSSWAQEISLDVEWAHAIAPAAHILLVEARSSGLNDLLGAVDYAASQPGVVAVSMSWGSGEFSSETANDFHFSHTGITFVASAGDTRGTQWPAVSPNVVGVGGSSLTLNSSGDYSSAAWNNQYGASGGGISTYEPKPSYQSSVPQTSTHRTSPDVGYNADPATGFAVYDSYATAGGWGQYGGTSAGAPQWAALIALADQGRTAPLSSSGTLAALYNAPRSTSLNDVVSNRTSVSYDLVTGLGGPRANVLVPYLQRVASTVSTPLTSTTVQAAAGKKSAPPAPVQPAGVYLSLGLSPQASYSAVSQPAASLIPAVTPLPNPVTVSQSVAFSVRQESGGGDNAAVQLDSTDLMIDVPMIPPVVPAKDVNSDQDGMSRVPGDFVPGGPAAIQTWRQACTACFENGGYEAVPSAAPSARHALPSGPAADAEPVAEPAAALAGMAFILGGYWGRQIEERDSEKRRRDN
jgi:hypothetical protein